MPELTDAELCELIVVEIMGRERSQGGWRWLDHQSGHWYWRAFLPALATSIDAQTPAWEKLASEGWGWEGGYCVGIGSYCDIWRNIDEREEVFSVHEQPTETRARFLALGEVAKWAREQREGKGQQADALLRAREESHVPQPSQSNPNPEEPHDGQ